MSQLDKSPPDKLQDEVRLQQATKLYQTAWMLIYGKRKSVERAIKCVQKAITFNDADYKYWQLLGEAYYQRGSLNPAINCFMKSLNIANQMDECHTDETRCIKNEDIVYTRLRMSDIRLSAGHFDEALQGYQEIIEQDASNVAALIGLTKTQLHLGRTNFSSNLVKSGHNHVSLALKYSLRSIKLCPHLCLVWKLASDCCLIQFIYGQKGDFQTIIDENFPTEDSDHLILDRATCIDLAQRFLCKALTIEPFQESACLWHNLGISLYLKSKLMDEDKQQTDILRRSLKCLTRALSNERENSQIKSSIGVVAFHLNLLNTAQSFLIKSIRNNLSTSEIQFSNLGYMYLQKGEFRLASAVFTRCQAEEPLYSRSWLGKALVEEQKSNCDNLSLLRHCHRLENNYQSLLMYATKIVTLPHVDQYSKDLDNALDCMQRIILYDQDSLVAMNNFGLLLERSGYNDRARLCFERAHRINDQDSRVIFNKLRQYTNQSRSCLNPHNSDGASIVADFIKTAQKLANSNNREYMLNFIYYLFTNGDHKSVDTRMTRFIDKLNPRDITNKACAQILLGLSAKAVGGDAKSWFFKNIIDLDGGVCIENLINIYCLMLFARLDHDYDLLGQMTVELPKVMRIYLSMSSRNAGFPELFYSTRGYWIRLVLLTSVFCLDKTRLIVQPLLALYPMIGELWLFMGISYIFHKQEYPAAIHCLKNAVLLGAAQADLCFVCNVLLSIISRTTTNKLRTHSLESRSKYLCGAVYRYPHYGLLWQALSNCNSVEIKHSTANSSRKPNAFSGEDFDLLDLAIKHVIKTFSFKG